MRPLDEKTRVVREFVLKRSGVSARAIAESTQIGRAAVDVTLVRLKQRSQVVVVGVESVSWSTRPVMLYGPPVSATADLVSITRAWCSSTSV